MAGDFERFSRYRSQLSDARWAAWLLGTVSAVGTLGSLALWIQTGVVGGALGFATTTAIVYLTLLFLLARLVPRRSRVGPRRTTAGTAPKREVSSHR